MNRAVNITMKILTVAAIIILLGGLIASALHMITEYGLANGLAMIGITLAAVWIFICLAWKAYE